jgi:hypothetical protein
MSREFELVLTENNLGTIRERLLPASRYFCELPYTVKSVLCQLVLLVKLKF